MPLQWRYQIWQSLEEGAGKRCSERDRWAKPAHNTPSLAFPASSPRSCPPTLQRSPKASNMAPKHARKREARPPQVKKKKKKVPSRVQQHRVPGEIKRREVELDPQVSPEVIMSREVELGCESWTSLASSCLSCSSTAVQRTLYL